MIDTVIAKEKLRMIQLKDAYENELKEFPRGSLLIRESGGRQYCYFRYRDGKRVITKYAGTAKELDSLKATIARRNELLDKIRELSREISHIERIENVR